MAQAVRHRRAADESGSQEGQQRDEQHGLPPPPSSCATSARSRSAPARRLPPRTRARRRQPRSAGSSLSARLGSRSRSCRLSRPPARSTARCRDRPSLESRRTRKQRDLAVKAEPHQARLESVGRTSNPRIEGEPRLCVYGASGQQSAGPRRTDRLRGNAQARAPAQSRRPALISRSVRRLSRDPSAR
jgi:hypothetical protein